MAACRIRRGKYTLPTAGSRNITNAIRVPFRFSFRGVFAVLRSIVCQIAVIVAAALVLPACAGGSSGAAGERDVPDAPAEADDGADADDAPFDPYAYMGLPKPEAAPTLRGIRCDNATAGPSLAAKADFYDRIARRLHVIDRFTDGRPRPYSSVHDVRLTGPGPVFGTPEAEWPAVESYNYAENAGLWSSLFVASQAFRYAVTKTPEAREMLLRTLSGTYAQMRVTGKPGLYAREYRNPNARLDCPAADDEYLPPVERVGNKWVRVNAEGCNEELDPQTRRFRRVGGCPGAEFAGGCWQRNASKDEYSGHMFAAGIVARIVDDPEINALARTILLEVGRHLVQYGFHVNDLDGNPTRYGSMNALAFDSVPGFNAIQALTYARTAGIAGRDEAIARYYRDCLLQEAGENRCVGDPGELPRDYRGYLRTLGINLGCGVNYDNVSMAHLVYYNLGTWEPDGDLRATYRDAWLKNTRGPGRDGQDLWKQLDPFRNFINAATASAAEVSAEPEAYRTLVRDGVCTLARFPSSNRQAAQDTTDIPEACTSGRHGSLAATVIPIERRCRSVFEWWGNPYSREQCPDDLRDQSQPAGYLLPYWMGRFFGFIGADD